MVVPSQSSYDPSYHLSYGDVLVDNTETPAFLEVRIKASKTDLFRKGVSVFLGVTSRDLYPAAANLEYMVHRGSQQGPFFIFTDGSFLTRDQFVNAVRATLDRRGVDSSHYAGQSFHIGAATTYKDTRQVGKFCIHGLHPNLKKNPLLHHRHALEPTCMTFSFLHFQHIVSRIVCTHGYWGLGCFGGMLMQIYASTQLIITAWVRGNAIISGQCGCDNHVLTQGHLVLGWKST